MGTDIHGVFQRRNAETKKWEAIPADIPRRHYQLFAVLADVRNGHGFAGVPTGEHVKPISAPRGYPEGLPVDENDYLDGEWLGDHSRSWLTGGEMLEWYAQAPIVIKTGIFDRASYEGWDKKSPPDFGYSGGIFGASVIVINDNAIDRQKTENWTHIRCEWKQSLREELAYFFDNVARLQKEYGTVRFVFGFDS